MSGITIKEYGLTFVWAALREYLGRSWPILLIFAAGCVLGIVFAITGRKKENPLEIVDARDYVPGKYEDNPLPDSSSVTWMFIGIVIFCALTVMNPFLVRVLIPKFGMTTVYYRFFWIIPITFGAAYWLTRAAGMVKKRVLQAGLVILLCAGMAWLMPLNPGIPNVRIPTNVYKVDGAVPVLCDAVHEDFEKTQKYITASEKLAQITDTSSKKWLKAVQKQYPLCVFPYGIEFAVRQYDPTIRLLFNRNLRLFYEGNTSTGISYGSKNTRYIRRKLILDAMYGKDPAITQEAFREAMDKTGAQYLIVEEHLANGGFLVQSGCKQVGVVAGYTIFKYGL
ncbi:MAG: hypothetical protein J6E32_04460 [Lachnospiraceae bacterium]|nr:hypothetical protein [Lachnospiraceae bacterium]